MIVFGDPLWAEMLSIANAFFAFLLAYLSFRRVRYVNGFMRWLLIASGVIGLYWGAIYVWVVITPAGSYNSVIFGQMFIRPAFTFTLALMASVALYRLRSGNEQ